MSLLRRVLPRARDNWDNVILREISPAHDLRLDAVETPEFAILREADAHMTRAHSGRFKSRREAPGRPAA